MIDTESGVSQTEILEPNVETFENIPSPNYRVPGLLENEVSRVIESIVLPIDGSFNLLTGRNTFARRSSFTPPFDNPFTELHLSTATFVPVQADVP